MKSSDSNQVLIRQKYLKLLHLSAIPFWIIALYVRQQMLDAGDKAGSMIGVGVPTTNKFYMSFAALAFIQFFILSFLRRSQSKKNSPLVILLLIVASIVALPIEFIIIYVLCFFGFLPMIAVGTLVVFHLAAYIKLVK